jgi:endonuclease/exonuclease/phosphatase family metal-dependent hydrolase
MRRSRGNRFATRRVVQVALSIALVASVSVVFDAAPADAASGGPYRMFQFNLCGVASQCPALGKPSGPHLDAVATQISGHKPHIATLNEICVGQYIELKRQLTAKGWTMDGRFQTTKRESKCLPESGCGTSCADRNRYGIAVLTRGTLSAFVPRCLSEADGSCAVTTTETRWAMCVTTTLYTPTRACTTHIGTSDQANQIARLTAWLNSYHASIPVLVGGDFNVSPSSDALDRVYTSGGGGMFGRFQEADACSTRTGQSDTCNEGTFDKPVLADPKLDYVFASADAFHALSADAGGSDHSDHDPLRVELHQCSPRAC